MQQTFFITGTDTGVGKTYVAMRMLNNYAMHGYTTLGIKPVACGDIQHLNNKLVNLDGLALQKVSSIKAPYETINPFVFEAGISPHLAAKSAGISLTVKKLLTACEPAIRIQADVKLIEGAGGWFTPINQRETLADFAKALNIPVILVVGMRLGCLNHALLTYHAIKNMDLTVAGWIANCIQPDIQYLVENVETLKTKIAAPCLDVVLYDSSVTFVA